MLDDSETDLWGGGGGGKPDASFSFLCHLPLRPLSLVELVRSMNMNRWHQHCGTGEERTGSVASQSYLRDLLSTWAYVHLRHLAHRCPDYYSGDQDLYITASTLDLSTWQSVLLAENMQIGSISARLWVFYDVNSHCDDKISFISRQLLTPNLNHWRSRKPHK